MAIYTIKRDGKVSYYRPSDENDQDLGTVNLDEYAEKEGCSRKVARAAVVSVCEDFVAKTMGTWDVMKSPNGTFVKQVFPGIRC